VLDVSLVSVNVNSADRPRMVDRAYKEGVIACCGDVKTVECSRYRLQQSDGVVLRHRHYADVCPLTRQVKDLSVSEFY